MSRTIRNPVRSVRRISRSILRDLRALDILRTMADDMADAVTADCCARSYTCPRIER
jgi:hypothetical protein